MGALFGKSKKQQSRVTEHDKAVLQLKQQRDEIKQYQKRIEKNLEKDKQLACKLLQAGKKERAKLLLRKKRFQEQILQRTDIQLENLEFLVHDLEFCQIEMQVINGLKVGNEALKKIHEVLNVEEVEKILDETREGVEKQQEIDDLLAGALTPEDEEAVEEELEQIIQAEMPDVPQEEPTQQDCFIETLLIQDI
ncbi:charged multivesicular body protein 6-A [Zootermopsis nevadensis]|uniref:Charged multivesicular body protein 6 n=1 Tax=Zootermopsis nevadensis TaxID=136037 RepID=A0A067QZ36_ZOONE|nr:charged multivesicular body protein 6-A [Zootermopsis nevadensis]KDR11542.1 Charged multivesicular body protein 6 [Zootermopsis nevadensis]